MHLEIPEALELAKLHRRQGRFDEAKAAYLDIIGRAPDYAPARHQFAMLTRDMGELEKAAEILREEIGKHVGKASLHQDLGVVLFDLRDYDGALASGKRARELDPGEASTLLNMGLAQIELHQWPDAIVTFRHALELDPGRVNAQVNLGRALYLENRLEESTAAYRRALQLSPGLPDALRGLAGIANREGNISRAVSLYRQALKQDPNDVNAQFGLARVKRFAPADPRFAQIKRALAAPDLKADDHTLLLFVLGKAYDDTGAYDDAFATFKKANEERAKIFPHDRYETERETDRVIAADAAMTPEQAAGVDCDVVPVFAAGLSRSGKSLIESLLARSGKALALGEKAFLGEAIGAVAKRAGVAPYPEGAPKLDRQGLAEIGRLYLEKCVDIGIESQTHTVDTSPDSYQHLGMILRCLPKAKIVLCQRHELDHALRIYFSHYYMRNSYAYDPKDIASYIADFRRLTAYWIETYGEERILRVQYEDLVSNPRETLRNITDFVGMTPLPAKATKGIHDREVGHWRHYERYLGELRSQMSEIGN